MLADKELEQSAAQLADFRAASETHNATLTEVIQRYTTLMDDYKRLKSDYEEERDSRERYKQMARGQERNPFVLVLIDGDGYVFDDDLVSNGAEGGQRAAQLVNDVVRNSLRNRGLEQCNIMVRIYANLAGLSKALSKAKLAGPEKRSLAPFTASFTRSNHMFDFVDAGELKENADYKIRALFRQFVDSPQCRHIYFGGCHDTGYLSELTPHVGNRDRITLITTPTFHHEFSKLGIRTEDFPNIFRATPLEGQQITTTSKSPQPRSGDSFAASITASAADSNSQICTFYQKGICKYGSGCKFLHVKSNTNGHVAAPHGGSLSDIKDWRQGSASGKSTLPFQMPQITKNDNDFMSGNNIATDSLPLRGDFAVKLPRADTFPRNEIAVNKYQHRLDAYIPPPSQDEKGAFQARIAVQKLCNNHHLQGNCTHRDTCDYDHNAVSEGMLNSLKQVVRNNPCPRKGTCRSSTCLNGHICQKPDCKLRGGKQYCKFDLQTHQQPLEAAEFMLGIGQRGDAESSGAMEGRSSKESMSPIPGGRSLQQDSDDEQEPGEGALLDLGDDDDDIAG